MPLIPRRFFRNSARVGRRIDSNTPERIAFPSGVFWLEGHADQFSVTVRSRDLDNGLGAGSQLGPRTHQ